MAKLREKTSHGTEAGLRLTWALALQCKAGDYMAESCPFGLQGRP